MPNSNTGDLSRDLPSTYQQVLENAEDIERLSTLVEGNDDVLGLQKQVYGYDDPNTGTHVDGLVDVVLPDPDDPSGASLVERVESLETSYDAGKIVSVNGSQLPLNVIPRGAIERMYDVSAISVMGTNQRPMEAGVGDTIRDTGDRNQLYYITDESVLGTPSYMDGLRAYASGYAADAGTVNGHTVDIDVPSNALFTDTIVTGHCTTAGNVAAKVITCHDYTLTLGNWLQVVMKNSNTAAALITLNVNGTGAKNLYINDVISSASNASIPAGTYLIYYGTRTINDVAYTGYWLRTDGNLPNVDMSVMTGATASVKGKKGLVPMPAAGDQDKVLFGSGSWSDIATMSGATASAAGKKGLVPAPSAGYQTRVLSGAGTWVRHPDIEIISSATQPTGQKAGDYWLQTLE